MLVPGYNLLKFSTIYFYQIHVGVFVTKFGDFEIPGSPESRDWPPPIDHVVSRVGAGKNRIVIRKNQPGCIVTLFRNFERDFHEKRRNVIRVEMEEYDYRLFFFVMVFRK